MATIKDVAARAGVSISTVSHVLNHTRRVSEEATRNVLEAVEALNYAPNSVARSLKVNNTRTIGLLVTASANRRCCSNQGTIRQFSDLIS